MKPTYQAGTTAHKQLFFVALHLRNASIHDQNIFNTAMAEMLSPIENPRYLLIAKKFKSELGFNPGAYISRCKLEEAKSLLTFTEKSLTEISNYLCYSSQAHFQTAFKKKYGMTPRQYRNKTQQI